MILDARRDLQARACIHCPRPDGLDRVANVLGAEPAGEHHAPGDRASPIEMGWVGLLPRQVDDARYLLTVAEKDGIATAHLPVSVRVELHEIGVPLGFSDHDRNGQHSVRHG